ncbi:uncharacterized protein LOC143927470 [Lithobates pipiens]
MGATMQHILRIIHPLLILTSSPGSLSQMIHVWQTPVIWATEGSSVTLPCDYRIIGVNASTGENYTVGSYKWYRHMVGSKAEVSDSNINYSGRFFIVHPTTFIHEQSAAMTLQPVALLDSGLYYCEVTLEIGQEISGYGNGTFLNVTASVSRPPSYTVQNTIRLILGGLVFLAILFFLRYHLRCFLLKEDMISILGLCLPCLNIHHCGKYQIMSLSSTLMGCVFCHNEQQVSQPRIIAFVPGQ